MVISATGAASLQCQKFIIHLCPGGGRPGTFPQVSTSYLVDSNMGRINSTACQPKQLCFITLGPALRDGKISTPATQRGTMVVPWKAKNSVTL